MVYAKMYVTAILDPVMAFLDLEIGVWQNYCRSSGNVGEYHAVKSVCDNKSARPEISPDFFKLPYPFIYGKISTSDMCVSVKT